MPSYAVRYFKTGPLTETIVDAPTREAAVMQMVQTAGPGESIEVTRVIDLPVAGATGGTGATGATGR